MSNIQDYLFVDFEEYCKKCVYYLNEEDDPEAKCAECLKHPARINSHMPEYFTPKED